MSQRVGVERKCPPEALPAALRNVFIRGRTELDADVGYSLFMTQSLGT